MLMVIFGAGASHDSLASDPAVPGSRSYDGNSMYRLPLADHLFLADRSAINESIKRFPQMDAIVPWLQEFQRGSSLESVLTQLREEAVEYRDRHIQLAAVRYYLQHMLWHCETEWENQTLGLSNYKTLLDEIKHYRKPDEKVLLVTFNYDRLLDKAVPFPIENIAELKPLGRKIILRAGEKAGLEFPCHPHQLRHSCGFYLASQGVDTRAIQQYLGHRAISNTTQYTALAPNRFDGFWSD